MAYKLIPPGSRRNNTSYILRGTIGGQRVEERTGKTTRPAAEQWAIDYIAGLQQSGPVAGEIVTFEKAARAYIEFRRPRSWDLGFIEKMIAWFNLRPDKGIVRDIVGADLVSAAHSLLPLASNAHKNRSIITNASAVLHYAQEQGWCPERRFRRLKVSRKSTRRPATPETMKLLLKNTVGVEQCFLAFLYEAGPRVTDLVRLEDTELDLRRAVAKLGSSKTDDQGEIGLSPELVAMVANTLARPFRKPPRVFPWRDRHEVYEWLKPLCKRLGVYYTPHLSRHAMATELRALGMDRKAIAERGIWRDERSVDRYDHHRSAAVPNRGVAGLLGKKSAGQRRGKKQASR